MKRRFSILIAGINVGTSIQQQTHNLANNGDPCFQCLKHFFSNTLCIKTHLFCLIVIPALNPHFEELEV